jgi:hypothetical protein
VKRLAASIAMTLALSLALVGVLVFVWWRGLITLPFGRSHHDLELQLRDRGPVAVAGGVPFGLHRGETQLVDYQRYPALRAALEGRDPAPLADALRDSHVDGLMVRTDRALGAPGTVLRALSQLRAVQGVSASYLDDTAAIYEPRESVELEPDDARRLIAVTRVILQGASPPADRLFPPSIRRPYPAEVAVIVRDGREPVLWRAVRGGSISRALVEATYAVLDRWNTRQQQRYGPLREAVLAHPITLAVFLDRGTLGTRSTEFLARAVDPRVFSIGYEQLGRWEYVLPPTPWAPIAAPASAISDLANEHDVAPPGYLRPELTLYRFRAFEVIELEPQGAVQVFDPGH